MEFVEAPAFTRMVANYLQEDEYLRLQRRLEQNPAAGDLMPGAGGFRKLRWQDPSRSKGRRGGLRLIYYYFASDHQIWLMTVYSKDEADDLTAKEKGLLREAIKVELVARKSRRSGREMR